jgi:lipid II:glycine glycyltransferase (peptidoglycan interpeptide bridge formation enzyme)
MTVDSFLKRIVEDAKADGCLCLYCSPEKQLSSDSCHLSSRHEQPEATLKLDLTKTEEELLVQMHHKGRYNIRLAEKNGVRVELSQDIDAFSVIMTETATRDRFQALSMNRYRQFLQGLPGSFLLLAYGPDASEKPIAGLLGVVWNGEGIYYYGASSYAHRALMAPYVLQWEAVRLCKAKGCHEYDLLGIAPPEAQNHPWAAITEFKRKFGGTVVSYAPEQQCVLQPLAYQILKIKRKILG